MTKSVSLERSLPTNTRLGGSEVYDNSNESMQYFERLGSRSRRTKWVPFLLKPEKKSAKQRPVGVDLLTKMKVAALARVLDFYGWSCTRPEAEAALRDLEASDTHAYLSALGKNISKVTVHAFKVPHDANDKKDFLDHVQSEQKKALDQRKVVFLHEMHLAMIMRHHFRSLTIEPGAFFTSPSALLRHSDAIGKQILLCERHWLSKKRVFKSYCDDMIAEHQIIGARNIFFLAIFKQPIPVGLRGIADSMN